VLTEDALRQALQRHIEECQREQQKDDNPPGKIYTVCSAKPGTGATTMAINIAASIAECDTARVALLDLDWPLGDAAAFLNIKPRFTVADALGAIDRLDPVLLESYMHKNGGMDVLAGFEDFGAADFFDAGSVGQLLEIVSRTYTHVVVDMPPTVPQSVFQNATAMSSGIVAVTTPDILSLRRTERLFRIFSSFDVSNKVRLVLNRFHRATEITEADIQKALGQPVTSTLANDYHACVDAMNAGKPIIAVSSRTLARNYRELTADLLGQHQVRRKGLLSLLPKAAFSFS
jgi:pilus assembly protein CpaE